MISRKFVNVRNLLSGAILFLILGNFGVTNAAAQTPEQTAESFYKWYLHELSGNREPTKERQTMLKFVSKRLDKWIHSKAYSDYGADYFLDAQNYDEHWMVNVSNVKVQGNNAALKVLLALPKAKKSDWKQTLAIKLIKENGVWKIDKVNEH
ncbi:MAG: YbjP/YqhG family protein [Acidobacteriota bacterium]|nr:YbjP/YqhG family protein [Acidobacteriota bacterium]